MITNIFGYTLALPKTKSWIAFLCGFLINCSMEQSFMATRKLFFGRRRGVTATQSVWRQLKSPVTLTFPGSWHLWDFSAGGNTVLILYFSWKPLRIYCPPVMLPSLLTHVLSLCSAYCFSCIISNLVVVPYFSSVFKFPTRLSGLVLNKLD